MLWQRRTKAENEFFEQMSYPFELLIHIQTIRVMHCPIIEPVTDRLWLQCQKSQQHQTKLPWHSCHIELLPNYPQRITKLKLSAFFFFYLFQNSRPSSALDLLAVAVHHLWRDALVLPHVLRHGLANQLEDVLSPDSHGLGHLHCQHVQSQDSSSGDLNFGHHRLTQLG